MVGQSINTLYKGTIFRSKTEARWAVFFDQLCIKWSYEPKTFHLPHHATGRIRNPDGYPYIPDFYLPDYNYWIEVKPYRLTSKEEWKCSQLAVLTGPSQAKVFSVQDNPSSPINGREPSKTTYYSTEDGRPDSYEWGWAVNINVSTQFDIQPIGAPSWKHDDVRLTWAYGSAQGHTF